MADKRRLQGEIDKCLKKVQEGCDIFDDIWEKFNASTNANQKEKFESDLKKEIKKLQRLRDQIKSWIGMSEIRDKQVLQENRKKIENRMEKFKVVEKETKTKAYSKEGLGNTKLDPAAKEKAELEEWLQQVIPDLEKQCEIFEGEIEGMQTGGGKKKGKGDKQKDDRLTELRNHLERHQHHISVLEKLLRMLNNDAIDVKQVKAIQEDVNYYVESNQDESFQENQFLYDDLDLNEAEIDYSLATGHGHADGTDSDNILNSQIPNSLSSITSTINHTRDEVDTLLRQRSSTASDEGRGSAPVNSTEKSTNLLLSHVAKASLPTSTDNPSNAASAGSSFEPTLISSRASSSSTVPFNSVPSSPASSQTANTTQTPPGLSSMSQPTVQSPPVQQQISYSNAAASSISSSNSTAMPNFTQEQSSRPSSTEVRSASTPPQSSTPSSTTGSSLGNSVSNSTMPSPAPSPASDSGSSKVQQSNNLSQALQNSSSISTYQNGPIAVNGPLLKQSGDSASVLRSVPQPTISTQFNYSTQSSGDNALSASSKMMSLQSVQQSSPSTQLQTSSIRLSPLLGVAPLGPKKLTKENHFQADMLMAAYQHMPHPSDSERSRSYLPRNPCPTPSYYPQNLPTHNDSIEFFQRLSTEALFFIFYYMEGSKAQYLAAKALKKQSWRFHTKYMMWFQRHDEPRSITDEYEQGTYIYFDYEKWGQRRKEGFTFEYRYLEDRDLS